jgi:hypothetical protein
MLSAVKQYPAISGLSTHGCGWIVAAFHVRAADDGQHLVQGTQEPLVR